jgi:hypothetical protein
MPERIFHPLCDDLLIASVLLPLQKMKGDHHWILVLGAPMTGAA